jgi:TonB-linked SusC/RagA family outer membrane protein
MLRQFVRKGMGALSAALLAAAIPLALQAQVGQITGNITHGDTGEPMSAVQVSVTGTGLGVVSGADGSFTIANVPVGTHVVVAQRLGFQQLRQENVTVSAGETTTLNLVLRPTVLALQEIVATGLVDPVEGVRSPISVARVTREMMPVAVAGNALQNLQGRVAGLSMTRTSGQPGEGVSIMLRSPTSLRGSGAPLVVVDGVILGGVIGDANTTGIEGMDIESMEVIRGAAASSLYGSRAAAGVIAITTARGQGLEQGQTRFSARSEYGVTQAFDLDDLPSHHQYLMTADNSSWADADGNPVSRADRQVPSSNLMLQFMDNPYPGPVYDNVSAVMQPGDYQAHQFSLSQNTASTNFALSLSRTQEGGSLAGNSGYYRNSFRINLDHRFLDALSLGISSNYVQDGRDNLSTSVFTQLLQAPRDIDLGRKDEDGNFLQQPDPEVPYQNPLWTEATRDNDRIGNRFLASANLRWDPFPWITASGLVSFDRRDDETRSYVPKGTPANVPNEDGEELDGSISFSMTRTNTWNAEGSLSLRQDFGLLNARTTFRALMERDLTETGSRSGSGFILFGVPQISNIPNDQRNAASTERERRALGYLVDFAFDYDAKYILTALGRRDGSSLFGADNRWHNYYRVATAWRLSEEDFWNFDNIQEFKLSYARGTAGGTPSWSNQYETWGLTQGIPSKNQLGNRNLRPEHTLEQEVSLDMVIRDTWGVQLVHSWQTTSDQIVPASIPAFIGYPGGQWVNAGAVSGWTTELTVETQLVQRANVGWNSLVVMDYTDATITDWPLPCDATRTWRFDCEGEPVYGIYGFRLLTDFSQLDRHRGGDAAPHRDEFQINDEGYLVWVGDFDYTDGLVNGEVTPGTWGTSSGDIGGRTYDWGVPFFEEDAEGATLRPSLGESNAFNLGWLNNVRWGGFNFHAQFHAAMGGVTNNRGFQDMINNSRNAPFMDQAGKPDGLKKPIGYYTNAVGSGGSTYITEKADYLKLRTLSVNYRFNQNQLQNMGLGNIGVQTLQVGLVGRNLLTLTPYSGWDPEQGLNLNTRLNTVGTNTYPSTRQLTAEVAVTF